MDTNRYYFSNLIEDDDLNIIAVKAKATMQNNETIVEIFRINNKILYSHYPRKQLFLMKQNSKSIFSPSSNNENSLSDVKPYGRISNPIRCNQDTSNMPRRYLNLDGVEKQEFHATTLELRTPTGRQKPVNQPRDNEILNSTIYKSCTIDKQLARRVGSTGSHEPGNQEPPLSAEIDKMTTNLTMVEKEFGSTAKVFGSIDVNSQVSPRSVDVSMMSVSLDMGEKSLRSPEEKVSIVSLGNQESPRSAEITRIESSHTVDDKDSRNMIGRGWRLKFQMAGDSATNKGSSPNPEENAGKSENVDINKYFISPTQAMEMLQPVPTENETLSPVKITKVCSIPFFATQQFASSAKNDITAKNSPEDTHVIISEIPTDNLNTSPNKTVKEIEGDDGKRKSPSPRKRSATIFKSIPRVIKLSGEEEIDIEVVDLEYGSSPTTSRSESADYRSDSIKDSSIKSPVDGESKTRTFPKTPERHASRSGRAISICNSLNVSETISSSSYGDVFAGKFPSGSPSTVATGTTGRSCKIVYSLEDVEASPVLMKATILKFNTLLQLRDKSVKNSSVSFRRFQSSINFIMPYVHNILHVIMTLDISGKYLTLEFKEIVREAVALYIALMNKLKSWEKDIDFDVGIWHKCVHEIERLKAQYEPLFTNEGKPALPLEILQVYECAMRAIWKKMDDMVMLLDSKRALFSHIAHDVESLTKMFVKTLILVGILQSR